MIRHLTYTKTTTDRTKVVAQMMGYLGKGVVAQMMGYLGKGGVCVCPVGGGWSFIYA